MGTSGYVHVEVVEIVRETDGAFLLDLGEDYEEEIWIPKVCVADHEDYNEGDSNMTMSIRESICREKGIEGSE